MATQTPTAIPSPESELTEAGAMAARGWVRRRSRLLTDAEGDYFNYLLNTVGFSNGPNLRNKYLHGSQATADSDQAHLRTYITALVGR